MGGVLVVWLGFTIGRAGGRGDTASGDGDEAGLRGMVLPEPMPKPDFRLLDTGGEPFDFRAETDGFLTLLFFGFTHCPDVCPVHLANLAAVLDQLPLAVRTQTRVVFVTVDPERDTPERIRTWLDAFDPRFIGLRGTLDEVNAILEELRLPPAIHGEPDEEGRYTVGHPSYILAFTPDGLLRALYPFGMRIADWAHDLPRLLELEPGADDAHGTGAHAAVSPPATGGGAAAPIDAELAYVTAPPGSGPAALYVTLRNRSGEADALVGASTPVAGAVELHRQVHGNDGTVTMTPVAEIPIPAGGEARLAPGGDHLMLDRLTRPLAVGDTFTVELRLRNGGTLPITAVVLPLSDVVEVVGATETAGGHAH